jgi:putative ABC transport system permease protein
MFDQDLRSAWRTIRRKPAFAAMAVVTLALGLGANTAMFSVIHAVLLRPLPYASADELVKMVALNRATGALANLSPADFADFARETRTLQRTGAHGWIGFFTVGDSTGLPERVGGVNVTAGFFPTLGVQFALGRAFTADEDAPNGPRVVILSHAFWQRRFGADRAIVGRTVEIGALPATVVGVLADSFRHVEANPEREADVFVPYQFDPAQPNRGAHFIRAVGRLRTDASVEQAQAELTAIARRLEQAYPGDNTNYGVRVSPLHTAVVADSRPALLLLAAAVGFVLLVACANLANLLLMQSVSRRTELAVRAAMGAGRWQIVRQLLVESLMLSSIGAVAGVIVAAASARALSTLGPAGLPRAQDIRVDPTVLAFAIALALITGIVAALLPALHASRGDLQGAVREGARGQARASLQRPTRDLLIAGQVAVALVLLAGASLMIRSLWQLMSVDTGFQVAQRLTFEIAVPTARYPEGEQVGFYERFYDAIRQQPGVESLGAINILPLSANYDSRGIQIDARPEPIGRAHSIQARSVSPGYFEAMEIPILRGRAFTARDREDTPRVAIISASMAARYWPGEDPIGQRLTFNSGIPREQQQTVGGPGSREVIGIVGDVKHLGLDEAETPMFYTPQAQQPSYHTMALVVRAAGDPAALTAGIRDALGHLDRGVPLYRVRTLDSLVRATVAAPRLQAWIFGLFAAVALALSIVGVYGVVSYLVGQRRQEIGIRLALGAGRLRVLREMLAEGLRPVGLGLLAGVAASLALNRVMTQVLFGIAATDAPTYAMAIAVLALSALVATWLPARRVLRVDPSMALRSE